MRRPPRARPRSSQTGVGPALGRTGPRRRLGSLRDSASEPFDTAAALQALTSLDATEAQPAAVAKGRQFLIDRQSPDGSWPETTRPAGQESYAQRISTTGWATLALLATSPSP